MKIDDRSEIAEDFICQLWEKKYFSTIQLKTRKNEPIEIIAHGSRNFDAGPDYKNISIKYDREIIQGDMEIHRAPEDWYLHQHHADPAYNNVILHLIIGEPCDAEPAIRLNRQPVKAEVFVNITEADFNLLAKKYKLAAPSFVSSSSCLLSENNVSKIMAIIDYFSRERLISKTERFREQHQYGSWNQVLYFGIMEALGYSKNQIPFRTLANLLPFEAIQREHQNFTENEALVQLQGLLLGAAGLLPSQDPSFDWKKIKDEETLNFVPKLEGTWKNFSARLGIKPMRRDEWLFFRLRPINFPTRRLAGASKILQQFLTEGILESILRIIGGQQTNHQLLIKELEKLFICKTGGYWATHYQLEENPVQVSTEKTTTLVGADRAKEIIINIILPVLSAYANEIDDLKLKTKLLQIYQEYPKGPANSIIKEMQILISKKDPSAQKAVNTAAKQQGLIHLYKLHCRRKECERCFKEWEKI